MMLYPFGERIVVRRKAEEKIGSIYVPEDVKKLSLIGEVIAKGPDCRVVSIGDVILFGRYSGFELPLNGDYKNCLVMNEEDTLAKITEGGEDV